MNELTREQILGMPAGRELDALVAEHVMGWHKGDSWGGAYWVDADKCSRYEILVFKPSLHINIAWEVEEHFNQDSEIRSVYMINLYVLVGLQPHLQPTLDDLYLIAHATPEQRCKAALLAVMRL